MLEELMPTRRDVLIGISVSAAAALTRAALPLLAKVAQPTTPVKFKVPAGSCDCHVHVFDPQHFPYAESRTYTPGAATLDELQAMHRYIRTQRVVIVQPSVYGTDNACMLDAIKKIGHHARGVAVVANNV